MTRHRILRGIREFFWSRGFLEAETPTLLASPSQEPYLEPMRVVLHDARGQAHDGFLRMSPEFSLKKLVALLSSSRARPRRAERSPAAAEISPLAHAVRSVKMTDHIGVFEIGSVFRDGEPWGDTHNPEFTMIEWYRAHADYRKLMADCEELVTALVISDVPTPSSSRAKPVQIAKRFDRASREISGRRRDFSARRGLGQNDERKALNYQGQHIDLTTPWERLTMRQAWRRYAHLDLDRLLTRGTMARACRAKGYTATSSDTFDDCFFKIHLTEVEPKLGRSKPTFLIDWPAPMAALARKKPRDARYAERVELYVGGLELANGFSELINADEQLARFREDQRLRKRLGRPVYPIDRSFIAALRRMPPTAGIALGIDRLVMLLTDAATIDEVRWLPAATLWE